MTCAMVDTASKALRVNLKAKHCPKSGQPPSPNCAKAKTKVAPPSCHLSCLYLGRFELFFTCNYLAITKTRNHAYIRV